SDIAQHLAVSQKVDIEDLDWETARRIGLTQLEIDSLLYFTDIESQTVHYFLEVAKLKVSRDPELLTFLTMWNYEEYFHSYALTRLLTECGVPVESATERSTKIRAGARFKARLEDFVQTLIAKLMPRTFVALWMFWGSLQECLTTQAYEEMARATANPVLAELCRRIAKQERRHFAYYFGQARKKLDGQSWAQKFTRWIARRFYAPVGGGVKTDEEGARLVAQLFPGDKIFEVMSYIEKRMAQLPGMTGLDCCTRWAAKVQPMLPPETRASSIPLLSAAA
ncbi:MAG TPA: acyl-ACP desaturase, partial [Kofleriaceae bacterium]|nr:acyl-ACP desaturase [Kofleriaceae bacterium]